MANQADIFAALQRSSTRARPVGVQRSTFESSTSLLKDDGDTNAHDLLCPREGCGSVILKSGVATLVSKSAAEVELDPMSVDRHPALPVLPKEGEVELWLVTPNAMAFENIGFSRDVAGSTTTSTPRKLLACAECDLGPLGWCLVGGTEHWLVADRVAYRT